MLKMQANRNKKVTATIRPEEHWVSQKVDQGNSYDHAAVELKAEWGWLYMDPTNQRPSRFQPGTPRTPA